MPTADLHDGHELRAGIPTQCVLDAVAPGIERCPLSFTSLLTFQLGPLFSRRGFAVSSLLLFSFV